MLRMKFYDSFIYGRLIRCQTCTNIQTYRSLKSPSRSTYLIFIVYNLLNYFKRCSLRIRRRDTQARSSVVRRREHCSGARACAIIYKWMSARTCVMCAWMRTRTMALLYEALTYFHIHERAR